MSKSPGRSAKKRCQRGVIPPFIKGLDRSRKKNIKFARKKRMVVTSRRGGTVSIGGGQVGRKAKILWGAGPRKREIISLRGDLKWGFPWHVVGTKRPKKL